MTLIERKSRYKFMRLIDSREADSVNYAMRSLLAEYGKVIKSVTCDNGSELSELSSVLAGAATAYYAHPYRSCERGTNEVHNKMIRRDFPKGESLDAISPAAVAQVEDKLNCLPRRNEAYRTPKEVFKDEYQRIRSTAKVVTSS